MDLLKWITGTQAADPNIPAATADDLKAALLALNADGQPWQVRAGEGKEPDLVAEWKLQDAQVQSMFQKASMTRTFRVLMKLDEATHTVRSVDQDVQISWQAGFPSLSFSASAFRGQEIFAAGGITIGKTDDGGIGKTDSYSFSSNQIKKPLQHVVEEMGWGWKGVAFAKL